MRAVLLVAVFLLSSSLVLAQDGCVTPARESGVCVNVKNCQPLLQILTGPRPIPESALELLRNSHCGFEGMDPKVCCQVEQRTTSTERARITTTTESPVPEGVTPGPPDVSNHPNLRLLPHDACGPVTQSKIVGGNKTGIFDFPWMALVAYRTGRGEPEFRCGGSLITKRYVLTAAHCVTGLPVGLTLLGVRLGEHDIGKERDCDIDKETGAELACAERYQDFLAESVVPHPGYTRSALQDDIALIRLDRDADFRPNNVRPICLPIGTASTLTHTKAVVTGWGATELGPRSQDLLRVQLSLVDTAECRRAYGERVQIWYKQLCAGGKKNMDSCLGDSGGPLQAPGLYSSTKLRYVQYGIVSYGLRSCGTEGIPGVYTRLAYYTDWILNNIRE